MTRRFFFALALAAAVTAPAFAQDAPLAGLTRTKLVAPLEVWFAAEANRDRLTVLRRATGVDWVPADIEFDPAGGKRAFVWRYVAPADLTEEAARAALDLMPTILEAALVKTFVVTGPQAKALDAALRFERAARVAPPTVTYLPEPLPMAGFEPSHYGHGFVGEPWNGLYAVPPTYRGHFGRQRVTPIPAYTGYGSCATCVGGFSPSGYGAQAAATHSAAAPTVARRDLVAGKKSGDWEALYDAGLSLYWAGRYADAAEHLAAAAELGDAPAAWSYLGLAQVALGHETSGRSAMRYAAALELARPGVGLRDQFERVQGATRAALNAARAEVTPATAAEVLAARPTLSAPAFAGK